MITAPGKIQSGKLSKSNHSDAGQDVHASVDITIPPNESRLVCTGLKIAVPAGFVGLLWSRSGLSVKHQIEVGAGCIDSDYRGHVKVHLYNHGAEYYTVMAGDRIAQLLTLPCDLRPYEQVDQLDDTDRNNAGFGSTGK